MVLLLHEPPQQTSFLLDKGKDDEVSFSERLEAIHFEFLTGAGLPQAQAAA